MVRASLIAIAASVMLGAALPATVDYRLGVTTDLNGPPVLEVEMRLRGDADGQTRIALPQAAILELRVSGATASTPDTGHRLLRHRPGAKLKLRYRLRTDGPHPTHLAAPGEAVFAIPEGRAAESATFRWGRVARGWRMTSDLDMGGPGHPRTVADIGASILLAGPTLQIVERAMPGGILRVTAFGDAADATRLADAAAPIVGAQRRFWAERPRSFLVAAGFKAPTADANHLTLPADVLARPAVSDDIARTLIRAWIPRRIGQTSAGPATLAIIEGLAGFYADRPRLREGLLSHGSVVSTLARADHSRAAGSRGLILALKWDEEIRRKTGGKADLDDVILRMADHYQRFPPGQGPDVITGLVSAAWVTAGIDLRPDIARYAEDSAVIPLPETLFDGCLDARVTVSPGFDSGFNPVGSFASKIVRGVRRGGPAWNSGLRNGMILESGVFTAGDMSREIELTVRAAGKRAKPRKIRFWPYGDIDVETRRLQMAVGLTEAATTACARKIAGL